MKRYIIAVLTIMIILSITAKSAGSSTSNTLTINVACGIPSLIPVNATIPLGQVVADGAYFTLPTEKTSTVTFEGNGALTTWTCTIDIWTQAYPPVGSGPKARIKSYWTVTDRGRTDYNPGVAEGGSFSFRPMTDACNAPAQFTIHVTDLQADPGYSKTDQVPFVFRISVSD